MPEQLKVLVVDDEESVVVTIKAILQLDGYNVATTTSGVQARAMVRDVEYDLVLTDLRLEDGDGLDVLKAVRENHPDTITIMLTGYASLESAIQAIRAGAYDYLVKPSEVEELRSTVARGIERRRLGQELRARVIELERANREIANLNSSLQRRIDEATAELKERYEQLKELDRMKSQFLSIASHELKTPITAMSGFLQVALRRVRRLSEAAGAPPVAEGLRGITEQLDVVYTRVGDTELKLDLARPEGDGPFPAVVVIHGGAWRAGDKSQVQTKPKAFNGRGYVLVSVNYRLHPAVIYKEQAGDIAQAIRWVHDHAKEHGGDPRRVFLMGHSAGAHLAAMQIALEHPPFDPRGLERLLLISGIFDLDPIPLTSINDLLGLDAERAHALSPMFLAPNTRRRVTVAVAERDTA